MLARQLHVLSVSIRKEVVMHRVKRAARIAFALLVFSLLSLSSPPLLADATLFGTATNYNESIPCLRVAALDYSGDGAVDLMVTPTSINWYMTVYGSGTGTFTLGPVPTTTGIPGSIAFGLFNDDEDLDMALACPGNNCVAVHINDGAGGFIDASNYMTNMTPVCVAAGDLNKVESQGVV